MKLIHIQNNSESIVRNKVTIISFIASILVVYVHSDNMKAYSISEFSTGLAKIVYYIESFGNKFTSIAVPMFFMLSGMLFFRRFEIRKIKDKLKSRFFSVLIPYLVWASLYYLYFILVTRIPFISNLINNSEPVEISLIMYLKWLWPNSYYTLWFLKNLIIFILMTPVIWALLNNHAHGCPTGLVVLGVLIFISQFGLGNFHLPEGMIYYLIGSYIGLNCRNYLQKGSLFLSIFGLGYFFISIGTGLAFEYELCKIVLLIALWYIMDLFASERVLPKFMFFSFFTYLAHDALLQGIKKIMLKLLGQEPVWALVTYILVPIVVWVVLVFIASFLKNKVPKLWKIAVGGR